MRREVTMLSTSTLLIWAAVIASVVMLAQHRPIVFPLIAAIVSAFELLSAFGLLHMSVARLSLGLVFGVALAVAGLGTLVRASGKPTIAASTVVTLVGALQTLAALHLH
jgi:hypothetical protein